MLKLPDKTLPALSGYFSVTDSCGSGSCSCPDTDAELFSELLGRTGNFRLRDAIFAFGCSTSGTFIVLNIDAL